MDVLRIFPRSRKGGEAEEEVFGLVIDTDRYFFKSLKKNNPAEARRLRRDFDKYMETMQRLHTDIGPNFSIRDVAEMLPNNEWIKYQRRMADLMTGQMRQKDAAATNRKNLRERTRRRTKKRTLRVLKKDED